MYIDLTLALHLRAYHIKTIVKGFCGGKGDKTSLGQRGNCGRVRCEGIVVGYGDASTPFWLIKNTFLGRGIHYPV
jgi:hypothetical protein